MLDLSGVIPPLCTPRGADGELDRASLARLCHALLDAGVHGLFIGGTTGEAALLDAETRLAALDVAVEAAAGRVPVLFGAIETGTRRVLAAARPAVDHGASAVVATVPFYIAPHPGEILSHYAYLRRHLDVPIVAYDIPSATHVRFGAATAIAVAREGDAIAIKDSSGDLTALRATIEGTAHLPFQVLSGSETLADAALSSGAHGLVPGLGNVDPAGFVRLYRAHQSGDHKTVTQEQRRLTALMGLAEIADRGRIGVTAATVGALKAALVRLGTIDHPDPWPPLGALTEAERARTGDLLAAAELAGG